MREILYSAKYIATLHKITYDLFSVTKSYYIFLIDLATVLMLLRTT